MCHLESKHAGVYKSVHSVVGAPPAGDPVGPCAVGIGGTKGALFISMLKASMQWVFKEVFPIKLMVSENKIQELPSTIQLCGSERTWVPLAGCTT